MPKQTVLIELLQGRRFDDARTLLCFELKRAQVFDPRGDREWAPIADMIAGEIERNNLLKEATIPF